MEEVESSETECLLLIISNFTATRSALVSLLALNNIITVSKGLENDTLKRSVLCVFTGTALFTV